MISVVIVEDDKSIAQLLEDYVRRYGKEFGHEFTIRKFGDGLALLDGFHADYDIVLMDIEMPYMDGMKAAHRMREIDRNVSLIFITNMAQYAIKGYEVEALAFMVKPVSYADFSFKLQKAIAMSERNREHAITVKVGRSVKVFNINDIYYLEVMRHSLLYHTSFGVFEVWDCPLKHMEEKLAHMGFARCNACYLVNLRYVEEVESGDVIVARNRLKMSRAKKQEFLEKLALFVGGGGDIMSISVLNILNHFFLSFNGSLIIPMLLFCFNLHFRKYGIVRLIGLLIPYFFIPFLYIVWTDPDYLATGQTWSMIYVAPWLEVWWYNFSYVIFFIAAMGIIWFSFQTTAKHVLFYGAAAYIVQNFIYNFNRTISYFIFGEVGTNIFVSFFGRIAVLIAFYYICVRRVRDEESLNLNNAFLILFSLIVLSVVNVLNMWLESLALEYNPDAINIQIAFLGTMCALLLIVVQFGFFDRSKLKNEKVVFEYLLHEAEHRQQAAKENIELINIKCHDMKHQLAVFSGLAGTEAQQQALDQLKQTISIYDSSVNTGNEMLNVVLSEKILRCEKYGINFTWLVNSEAISFLGATDVYSLFGNALDNAIEAVGAEKENNRIIMLNVGVKGAFVNIMLENSCSVALCFGEDGLPKTTKRDARYHGFGVKSIKYIAQKYGGTVAMQQVDNKFKLSVLFPKRA